MEEENLAMIEAKCNLGKDSRVQVSFMFFLVFCLTAITFVR
jgi:hypothetical protein